VGAASSERLFRAAVLSGLAYLAAAPYIDHLSRPVDSDQVREQVLGADLLTTAAVVVISALVGTFFAARNGLPGLGDRRHLRAALPFVAGALGASILLQFLIGEALAKRLPAYYPSSIGWALAIAVKGAVFDEVVARYGMLTLIVGATRTRLLANLCQAIFFTVVAWKSMGASAPSSFDGFVAAGAVSTFAIHLAAGAVYLRFGLIAAALFHFAADLRFVLHALLAP
jgi:hypothetical protein